MVLSTLIITQDSGAFFLFFSINFSYKNFTLRLFSFRHYCESFLEDMVALKNVSYEKYERKLKLLERLDLLILDDFLLHTITDEREVEVLFMILEKRCETQKSTIVCSQREPKSWASMILNDEVSANAITKRATKHYTVVINTKNNK